MLDRMNKKIRVEQNDKAIALLRRHNLYLGLDFILFMPDETPAHLQETLDWLRRVRLADYMPQDHYYSYFLPYPGTPLRSYYEGLFGTQFSNDELPRPDDYFIDEHTRRIFRYFVRDFAPVRRELSGLVDRLEKTSARADVDPGHAQRARLEAFSMRHLPFRVLSALVASPQAASLYDAAPWLANFDRYRGRMEALCAA